MDQKIYYEKLHTIGNLGAKVLFFLLTVLLPCYFDKRIYLALIDAKGQCYTFISVVGLIFVVIYIIFAILNQPEFKKEKPIFLKNKLDLAVLFFAVSVFVSFLFSADKRLCLTGEDAFRCGTYMVLTCIIFYFFISRNLVADHTIWDNVFWVMDILMLMIILHTMSIDIFGMHYNIIKEQYVAFLGTFGNVNSISPYICLMLPVGIVFYVNDEKKSNRQFYGLFVVLALMATFQIQTEGVFIGLAFEGLFLFPYLFSDYNRFVRMFDLGIMAGIDLVIVSILNAIVPQMMLINGSSVSHMFVKYWVGVPVIIFCVLMRYLLSRRQTEVPVKVRKICAIFTDGIIGLSLAAFVIATVRALRSGIRWGSGRSDIWKGAVKLFGQFNLKEKLIGLGTEMLTPRLTPVVENWDLRIANAHNNILEALLSIGIIGTVAYLCLWAAIVIPFFKKERKIWSMERVAYFLGLVGYFGQSIVGNPYSVSVPLVFLILSLYRNQEYLLENPNVRGSMRVKKKKG